MLVERLALQNLEIVSTCKEILTVVSAISGGICTAPGLILASLGLFLQVLGAICTTPGLIIISICAIPTGLQLILGVACISSGFIFYLLGFCVTWYCFWLPPCLCIWAIINWCIPPLWQFWCPLGWISCCAWLTTCSCSWGYYPIGCCCEICGGNLAILGIICMFSGAVWEIPGLICALPCPASIILGGICEIPALTLSTSGLIPSYCGKICNMLSGFSLPFSAE
jgi:hypothetical protein